MYAYALTFKSLDDETEVLHKDFQDIPTKMLGKDTINIADGWHMRIVSHNRDRKQMMRWYGYRERNDRKEHSPWVYKSTIAQHM